MSLLERLISSLEYLPSICYRDYFSNLIIMEPHLFGFQDLVFGDSINPFQQLRYHDIWDIESGADYSRQKTGKSILILRWRLKYSSKLAL